MGHRFVKGGSKRGQDSHREFSDRRPVGIGDARAGEDDARAEETCARNNGACRKRMLEWLDGVM